MRVSVGAIATKILNRRLWLILALGLGVFILFFWRLGSLTKGLSPAEAASRLTSKSLQAIVNNPINAPHHLLQYLFSHFGGSSALNLRLPSAILAVIFIGCFYLLARAWFGKIVGLAATLITVATPLIILSARSATSAIMFLFPLAVLASYYWLTSTKTKQALAWTTLCAVAALAIYTPGSLWLLAAGLIVSRKALASKIAGLSLKIKILGITIAILILVPLIYGLAKNPEHIKQLLLIPADWPSVVNGLKYFVWSILALFWKTREHIDLIIGRLPILDATQIVLFIFGAFALARLARKWNYGLASTVVLGLIAVALNNNLIFIELALPAICLFVAGGLKYLYVEWQSVFPRNPIPRYLALFLISVLVILHIFWGLSYSLSAWPNTSATKSTYVLK